MANSNENSGDDNATPQRAASPPRPPEVSRDAGKSDKIGDVKSALEPAEVRIKRRTDYNRLVRTARLTSILLESNTFSVHSEAVGISKSLLKRDLTANASALASGVADNICVAKVEWTVKYAYQRRSIVRCVSTYIVSFEGMKEFSEDVVNIYVETNAKAMTYSYFRALYAHLDWCANLGSAPLPIVQFQAKV